MNFCYKHQCNNCLHCTIENQTKEIIAALEKMYCKKPSVLQIIWMRIRARGNK